MFRILSLFFVFLMIFVQCSSYRYCHNAPDIFQNVKVGDYNLQWATTPDDLYKNRDFKFLLRLQDSAGTALSESISCYIRPVHIANKMEDRKERIWPGAWDNKKACFVFSGLLDKPGRWNLNIEFYGKNEVVIKKEISVGVFAERKRESQHEHRGSSSGGFQGGGGSCH